MKWQRTSDRYLTRYRSTDARYMIESIGGANTRRYLRRRRLAGSDLVGVFATAHDASAAADVDAVNPSTSLPGDPGRPPKRR